MNTICENSDLFCVVVFHSVVSLYCSAIREDGMPGGRNKSIGPVQVNHILDKQLYLSDIASHSQSPAASMCIFSWLCSSIQAILAGTDLFVGALSSTRPNPDLAELSVYSHGRLVPIQPGASLWTPGREQMVRQCDMRLSTTFIYKRNVVNSSRLNSVS